MPVMYAPTIPGAQEGVTTFDPAQLLGDPRVAQLAELIQALVGAKQPQAAAPPIGDVLGEQRLRSEALAGSLHPSAQYQQNMNPGGLADVLAGAVGAFGYGAPQFEQGQRLANRVPLENWGGSPEAAAQFAQQFTPPPAANPYQEQIDTLVKEAVRRALGETTPGSQTMGIGGGNAPHAQAVLPNEAQYQGASVAQNMPAGEVPNPAADQLLSDIKNRVSQAASAAAGEQGVAGVGTAGRWGGKPKPTKHPEATKNPRGVMPKKER